MACAKCHDHKFDPISQKDYYQLSGFFNNIRELGMTGDDGNYGPLLYLPNDDQEENLDELNKIVNKTKFNLDLTKKELSDLYKYVNDLPSKNQIDKNLIGYYPFDKINPVKTKKNSQYIISEKSSSKPDYFILDENRNVNAEMSPTWVTGVSGKAL